MINIVTKAFVVLIVIVACSPDAARTGRCWCWCRKGTVVVLLGRAWRWAWVLMTAGTTWDGGGVNDDSGNGGAAGAHGGDSDGIVTVC